MRETTLLSNKILLFLFLTIVFSFPVFPQSPENCFHAEVKDANGAAIVGAQILLKNPNGETIQKTESGERGEFDLRCSGAGVFNLQISKSGMEDVTRNVILAEKNSFVSEIVLSVEQVRASVIVKAKPDFVNSISETATRTATPLRDVPQSVEIVNRALLDAQGARSLSDALSNVTAVSVAQGEGRRDQFFIRGFNALGDQFVDGVRDDAAYYRDLANVEQIEVVKGPAAVLFGRGSSGGIINRTTKKPNVYARVGGAEINFGSFGLKRGSIDFGQPIFNEKLAFRFVGALEKSHSFRRYAFQNRYNIAPSLIWKPDARTDVLFQFEFLNDRRLPDRGFPSYFGRVAEVPVQTYYGLPERDRISNLVSSQALKVERRVSADWLVRNTFRRISAQTNFYNSGANGICVFSLTNGNCVAIKSTDPKFSLDRLGAIRFQYNGNSTQNNYFNQTETVGMMRTGGIKHTILTALN